MVKFFLVILISLTLTGCVARKPIPVSTKLIEQVKIPPLAKNKGRVFFYNNGYYFKPGDIEDIEAKLSLATISPNQCTYIDLDAGIYKFRAVTGQWGAAKPVTEIALLPGSTHYMVMTFRIGFGRGMMSIGRGSHLMHILPEVGKNSFKKCNYVYAKSKPIAE